MVYFTISCSFLNRRNSFCYTIFVKSLTDRIKGKNQLIFIDFEGTEKSHEIISIGAIKVSLDFKGSIKKKYPSFYTLVKAEEALTPFITRLTKIKQTDLDEQGLTLHQALKKLHQYIGSTLVKKTLILVFAPHDFRLLRLAMERVGDPKDKAMIVSWLKAMMDFQALLAHVVQDDHGNPLSLNNYIKTFNLQIEGQDHHAEIDAIKLLKLYEAFVSPSSEETLKEQYLSILKRGRGVPKPIQKIVLNLIQGNIVTREDLLLAIEEYLKA